MRDTLKGVPYVQRLRYAKGVPWLRFACVCRDALQGVPRYYALTDVSAVDDRYCSTSSVRVPTF